MPSVTETIRFYDDNAPDIAAAYEKVDFSRRNAAFARLLAPGDHVLELGCGSGRDAAELLEHGLDVTAVDGSGSMVREAARLHPELRSRLRHVCLPGSLPFEDGAFRGVVSWAMIMHLRQHELPELFEEVGRVVAPGGVFGYSVNTERVGLDALGNDARGRHFTCLNADDWEKHHAGVGFRTLYREEADDIVGRAGIRWVTFLARKAG